MTKVTKEKKERVRMICGQGFERLDIPAWLRRKEEEDKATAQTASDGRQEEAERKEREKSKCCNDDMLSSGQCLNCGADGRKKEGCELCGYIAEEYYLYRGKKLCEQCKMGEEDPRHRVLK